MAQEVSNFARFYAAFGKMKGYGDMEEVKKSLVSQYTGGRTESLREMRLEEYNACCAELERITGSIDERRKRRSECLKLMQRLGIDTSDWARVNSFCENPRIAGKPFARINTKGLEELAVKLRAIYRNGGLHRGTQPKQKPGQAAPKVYMVPVYADVKNGDVTLLN